MKDDDTPLETILRNFIEYVDQKEAKLKEGDDPYHAEFQELKRLSDSLKHRPGYSTDCGQLVANRRKNRYKDILPFDMCRVVLTQRQISDTQTTTAGADYINASYILGASGSRAYIAAQGPLPHTVGDFWRCVVDCDVQIIIMACNETESGKHKCDNYWPSELAPHSSVYGGGGGGGGAISVQLQHTRRVCRDFLVRKFVISYATDSGNVERRQVCQFHYHAWPDHGVPRHLSPLMRMLRLVRSTQRSETLPLLVHCSAGCGRTGCVCAVDYVAGLLRTGRMTSSFSVMSVVAAMRRQRAAMVQTRDQYVLVHRAVRRLFRRHLRLIDAHHYENVVRPAPAVSPLPPTSSTLIVGVDDRAVDVDDLSARHSTERNDSDSDDTALSSDNQSACSSSSHTASSCTDRHCSQQSLASAPPPSLPVKHSLTSAAAAAAISAHDQPQHRRVGSSSGDEQQLQEEMSALKTNGDGGFAVQRRRQGRRQSSGCRRVNSVGRLRLAFESAGASSQPAATAATVTAVRRLVRSRSVSSIRQPPLVLAGENLVRRESVRQPGCAGGHDDNHVAHTTPGDVRPPQVLAAADALPHNNNTTHTRHDSLPHVASSQRRVVRDSQTAADTPSGSTHSVDLYASKLCVAVEPSSSASASCDKSTRSSVMHGAADDRPTDVGHTNGECGDETSAGSGCAAAVKSVVKTAVVCDESNGVDGMLNRTGSGFIGETSCCMMNPAPPRYIPPPPPPPLLSHKQPAGDFVDSRLSVSRGALNATTDINCANGGDDVCLTATSQTAQTQPIRRREGRTTAPRQVRRSLSLKMASQSLHVAPEHRPNSQPPAYLALERGALSVHVACDEPAVQAALASPAAARLAVIGRYERSLIERSRRMGLNDTLLNAEEQEEQAVAAAASAGDAMYVDVTTDDACGDGGRASKLTSLAGLLSPSLVSCAERCSTVTTQAPPVPTQRRVAGTRQSSAVYSNCTALALGNRQRIDADLSRNPRCAIYDATSGDAHRPAGPALRCRRPSSSDSPTSPTTAASDGAASVLAPPSWTPRQRSDSFRQAVNRDRPRPPPSTSTVAATDTQQAPLTSPPPPRYETAWTSGRRCVSMAVCSESSPTLTRRRSDEAPASASQWCCVTAVGNSTFYDRSRAIAAEDLPDQSRSAELMRSAGNSVFYTAHDVAAAAALRVSHDSAFEPYQRRQSHVAASVTDVPHYAVVHRSATYGGSRSAELSLESSLRHPSAPPRRKTSSSNHRPNAAVAVDLDPAPAVPQKTPAAYCVPPSTTPTAVATLADTAAAAYNRTPSLKSSSCSSSGSSRVHHLQPVATSVGDDGNCRPLARHLLERMQATASNWRYRLGARADSSANMNCSEVGASVVGVQEEVNANSRKDYI